MQKNTNYILFIVTVLFLIGGGYFISKYSTPAVSQNEIPQTSTSSPSSAPSEVKNQVQTTVQNMIGSSTIPSYLLTGKVNMNEVGGANLSVFVGSRISMVTPDGVFAAMPLSKDGLTIVAVKDGASKVRAYGVAFPDTHIITLGARSTAEATLIDPTADLTTARAELVTIDALKCFPAYVTYLQKELPIQSIDNIQKATSPNDTSNPHNVCLQEIKDYVKSQGK